MCGLLAYGAVKAYANSIVDYPEKVEEKVGASAWLCNVCASYLYDPLIGCPLYGIAPGTQWPSVPETFCCPICGAPKDAFIEYYKN